MSDKPLLNDKQTRFAEEYLLDLNATQAAIRAGYSAKTAAQQGERLLRNAEIRRVVREGQLARSQATGVTREEVLKRWWMIATADPNELIEYRRTCCRFCYGTMHRWQETQNERAVRFAQWEAYVAASAQDDKLEAPGRFDELGGIGWDPRRAPLSDCIECFGDGIERPYPKDTRLLSPQARALFAGVKTTRDGIEIRMNSQESALANVAKHLGMFVEKHEHSGPGGGPIATTDAVDVLAKLSPDDRASLRELALKLEGQKT